jgi:hypothetical protein
LPSVISTGTLRLDILNLPSGEGMISWFSQAAGIGASFSIGRSSAFIIRLLVLADGRIYLLSGVYVALNVNVRTGRKYRGLRMQEF